MPKKPKANISLTGYFKLSGHIAAIRECLRVVNQVAEAHPEELTSKFADDFKTVVEEVGMVSEFVSHRLEEANPSTDNHDMSLEKK